MSTNNTVNLYFDVSNQSVRRTDTDKLASGAIQTAVANFDFSGAWDGLYKYCRFEGAGGIKDVRIVDDKCVIPWEVLEAPGFKMACYGTEASDMMLTTEKVWVKVYQSVNFMVDDVLPKDETPSMLMQYEQVVNDAVAAQADNNAQQQANNDQQQANNDRTEGMVSEVFGMVGNELVPLVSAVRKATDDANFAAERADNAIVDLESGVIPSIGQKEIERVFGEAVDLEELGGEIPIIKLSEIDEAFNK